MDAGEVEGRTAARRAGVVDAVTTAGMTVSAIVFLRIAFGLWMLYHEAWEKLHTWTPQTLPRIIGMWAKNPEVAGFYRSFLQDVAAPNAGFFRGLVTSWELVFALCMLAGLGVRVLAPIQVTDTQTGSRWDPFGRATAGPLAGARLRPATAMASFWFDWAAFHPDTAIWDGP